VNVTDAWRFTRRQPLSRKVPVVFTLRGFRCGSHLAAPGVCPTKPSAARAGKSGFELPVPLSARILLRRCPPAGVRGREITIRAMARATAGRAASAWQTCTFAPARPCRGLLGDRGRTTGSIIASARRPPGEASIESGLQVVRLTLAIRSTWPALDLLGRQRVAVPGRPLIGGRARTRGARASDTCRWGRADTCADHESSAAPAWRPSAHLVPSGSWRDKILSSAQTPDSPDTAPDAI